MRIAPRFNGGTSVPPRFSRPGGQRRELNNLLVEINAINATSWRKQSSVPPGGRTMVGRDFSPCSSWPLHVSARRAGEMRQTNHSSALRTGI